MGDVSTALEALLVEISNGQKVEQPKPKPAVTVPSPKPGRCSANRKQYCGLAGESGGRGTRPSNEDAIGVLVPCGLFTGFGTGKLS
ncbi:MAG: hypothetical protein AB4352_18200 [Hormoscilla sp.]